ncbi:MAG: sugar ABC transporter permease [Clostridia bacterium]|nr:sugar ABC transporter permease [Clostridia bacterium]
MKKAVLTKKRLKVDKSYLFYLGVVAFPLLQFCVFYIGVNFNSILMCFQNFDPVTGEVANYTFENVEKAFRLFFTDIDGLPDKLLLSIGLSVLITLITTPLCLLFSFYIAKKRFGSSLFRVFLFMPSILSSLVLVTVYQFFVERGIPEIVLIMSGERIEGIMQNADTRYYGLLFFNIWFSFGGNMLIYSNAMSGINPEIIEAANLDGATGIKEFWYISFPSVWSTFSTFMVVTITGIFTNQFHLFSFYGSYAPENMQTLGYYLYKETQLATSTGAQTELSHLSALGIILTCITLPLAILVRKLMEKFGYSEE